MTEILFYCRSGYEADLLAELEYKCAQIGQYGYAKLQKHSAVLIYSMPQLSVNAQNMPHHKINAQLPRFSDLVFARQKAIILSDLSFDTHDRVAEIIACLLTYKSDTGLPELSDVMVEHADTEDGKTMAKFCKKFVVPLRSAMRKAGILSKKPNNKQAYLHLLFSHSQACTLAISHANDRSEYAMGIQRLKMPSDAPSRSTLKLEEAIKTFLNKHQAQALLTAGMTATDLGACPGGWTYQLVHRGITVEAVDHGEIDEKLMATGLVNYFSADGFLHQPEEGNVNWLVCDMIEQPTRVSELMVSWLASGKANASIFNLKLPMNKRFKVVQPILEKMHKQLSDKFGDIFISAKHLYHNRDEVTVIIIVNSQMLQSYADNA